MRQYAEMLLKGHTIMFRPHGNSMSGKIESGDLVTVVPLKSDPQVGDTVLCKVEGHYYLHSIKRIDGERFLIGNNRGRENGWTPRKSIFGKVTNVCK